jgi:hypothetical protein
MLFYHLSINLRAGSRMWSYICAGPKAGKSSFLICSFPVIYPVIVMEPNPNDVEEKPDENTRPMFVHQPWMVGIVLIFGVLALVAGLSDPIWLCLGAPCILVLFLFIYVRFKKRDRGEE